MAYLLMALASMPARFGALYNQGSGARRPRVGQRPEDGRPQGSTLAKPRLGSRQPYLNRGLAQNRNTQWPRKLVAKPFPRLGLVNSATGFRQSDSICQGRIH